MHGTFQRAVLLYQHSRYADAERELRRLLAEQPQEPRAHALLGLCLAKQERLDEAQREVEQAVSLAPDWPYVHYCRSIVLDDRSRHSEAEAAAREAVRLDPADADYHARLAATLYHQGQWDAARQAAEQGLQHDAEHSACGNMRTMALTKLGRHQEALAAVDASLARDPDDALAHANKAWALLHQGRPRPALEHFGESLRLDPTLEYARQGMVEALKARNPVYRVMLAYFLWMSRLDDTTRWGVIIGGYFGVQSLRRIARAAPALEPWIWPLFVAYFVFVLLTWFAMPAFNLLLRLNRYGRHALSRDQRRSSAAFGLCLLASCASAAGWLATRHDALLLAAVLPIGLALPLVTLFHCEAGWPRQAMTGVAAVMATVGTIGLAGVAAGQPWGSSCIAAFGLGFLATPWLANWLAGVTVKR